MECPRCQRTIDAKLRRCNWCGVNVPAGQHLLEESGIVVPIRANDTSALSAQTSRLATLGDRLIAVVLDTIILLVACALVDVWVFMKWGVISGGELRITAASLLAGGSLDLIIGFLYLWVLEASVGSTLGKAIMGIGVVNNSNRSSMAASAIRNLLRVVDGVGFYFLGALIASCTKFRRRLGDLCAGTYVVQGNLSELTRALSVVAWFLLLSVGVWALPHVCSQPKPSEPPRYLGQSVVQIGRTDKSIYLRTPNHRVDLSMTRDGDVENARSSSQPDSAKAPKLENQDPLPVVP
jgi:uncharacterized RDD family membrane protein YckC